MTPDIDITSGFDNNFEPRSVCPSPFLSLFIHFFKMSQNPLKEYFYNFFLSIM